MIKVVKGAAPAELLGEGAILTQSMKDAFDRDPPGYTSGKLKFSITDCYKSAEVVDALIACQHNKCCFSEAPLRYSFLQVEHFRPKGRIDGYKTKSRIYPGYYWLAYDWDNLFLCNPIINVRFKRTLFPLSNEHERNLNHHTTNVELPLLIDPSADEPRDHIRFYRDEPVYLSDRGKLTIELLGLRHSDFEEGRRKHLAYLEGIRDLIDIGVARGMSIDDPIFAFGLALLRQSVLPEADFSSMAIDFLSGWPHL